MSRYAETYAAWQADPQGFWQEAAKEIDWFTPATSVFNPDSGVYGRWFDGATCNTCYNCVDRHVADGHGDRLAVIHDSPVTGQVTRHTYAEVQAQVSALASVLRGMGVASSAAAKPPKTTECTAPRRAQASMAKTASATIGM